MRKTNWLLTLAAIALVLSWGANPLEADQSGEWEAILAASSGPAAAGHANQLRDLAAAECDARWAHLASYLEEQLRLIGVEELRRDDLAEATVEHFPGQPGSTWRAIRAELRDVKDRRVAMSLATAPNFVAEASASVKLEGVVVDVGSGVGPQSYVGKDVAGMLVLASGPLHEVYREAVLARGAIGIVSYFEDELERGILDPQQLPPRSLNGPTDEAVRPGTFGVTILQEDALRLRRALMRGNDVVFAVDIETDLRVAEVETVSALVYPSIDAAAVRDANPVLLFADFGVGGDTVNVDGAAVLLEVVRTLTSLMQSGEIDPVRPVVALWSSDPAAVRSFVASGSDDPIAAFELRNVGFPIGARRALYLVEPPLTHASWLSDWIELALNRSDERGIDVSGVRTLPWDVRRSDFDVECDPYLLNRDDLGFPTFTLAGNPPCDRALAILAADESPYASEVLERIVAATVEALRPILTGEKPTATELNRMGERVLSRQWVRGLSAFAEIDQARAQGETADQALSHGIAAIDEARRRALGELESWVDSPTDNAVAELRGRVDALDELIRSWVKQRSAVGEDIPVRAHPRIASVTVGPKAATPPVATATPPPAPVPTARPTPRRPTPRPTAPPPVRRTAIPPTPTRVPPTVTPMPPTATPAPPTPTRPAATPTPAVTSPAEQTAARQVAVAKRHYEAGRCAEALRELEKVTQQTPQAHQQASVLKTVIEKRMELSRTAFREGLTHLTERRRDQALAAFRRVQPCTADEYAKAQEQIRSIQAAKRPAGGSGDCESLGVLRATRTQGDGRTVSGNLSVGAKQSYCFDLEAPGYGDLEVLVPTSFSVEGMGLMLTGTKKFVGSTEIYARYAVEKLQSGTHAQITIVNSRSQGGEFECEIYLYPR